MSQQHEYFALYDPIAKRYLTPQGYGCVYACGAQRFSTPGKADSARLSWWKNQRFSETHCVNVQAFKAG